MFFPGSEGLPWTWLTTPTPICTTVSFPSAAFFMAGTISLTNAFGFGETERKWQDFRLVRRFLVLYENHNVIILHAYIFSSPWFSGEPDRLNGVAVFVTWFGMWIPSILIVGAKIAMQVFDDALARKSSYTDGFSKLAWEASCFQLQKVVVSGFRAFFLFVLVLHVYLFPAQKYNWDLRFFNAFLILG